MNVSPTPAAADRTDFDVAGLRNALRGGRRLVIFTHDSPDPDAIAAAWLLQHIAERAGLRARIVHGGRLGRAENRTMAAVLRIPLHRLEGHAFRPRRGDRFALVDTQPGSGNNSFPRGLRCHVVLDHHPPRRGIGADHLDIRTDGGCTATLALGYFEASGATLDSRLATAVAYAIISETQDLKREAMRADRETLQRVLPRARLTDLGRIRHPVHSRAYYETIARALHQVRLGRNLCVCHIGPVPVAELVAEVADLLKSMERVTLCLVTGWHDGLAILSLRAASPRARAERVMCALVGREGHGGGHGMIAGGSHPCPEPTRYSSLAETFTQRLLTRFRTPERPVLRPLLQETTVDAGASLDAEESSLP